jgi:hypothetical protein
VNLLDFEMRVLRYSTQFFSETRNANHDDPEANPLDQTEDEWVNEFITWLLLVPKFEAPEPTLIPDFPPAVAPDPEPEEGGTDENSS